MITIRHERERLDTSFNPGCPRITSEFTIHDDVGLETLLAELTRIVRAMDYHFTGELGIVNEFPEPTMDEIRYAIQAPARDSKRKRKR